MSIKVGDEVVNLNGYLKNITRKVVAIIGTKAIYEVPAPHGVAARYHDAQWLPYLKTDKRYLIGDLSCLVLLKRGNKRIPRRYT